MRGTRVRIGLGILMLWLTTGCSIYKIAGNAVSDYAVSDLGPYILSTEDLEMGCQTGQALGNLLLSFDRVGSDTNLPGVVTLFASGLCAELQANEAELGYHRALFAKKPTDAMDARIVEQRAHAVAASRYARAWEHMIQVFGEPQEGQCPDLAEDERLFYLVGLAAGVQAILHDRASGGQVGMDMSVLSKVARATQCVDDNEFWQIPSGFRFALYASVPGSGPADIDPVAKLREASKSGEALGVKMGWALLAQTGRGIGQTELVKEAIAAAASRNDAIETPALAKLLDKYALGMLTHFSDVQWTEDRGHRTPVGSFGTFFQAAPVVEEDDDLLDDL